jgi:hypothetical protein
LQHVSPETIITFLQAIERQVFVYSLISDISFEFYVRNEQNQELMQLAFSLANHKINADKIIRTIIDETNTLCKNPQVLTDLQNNFKSNGFYGWRAIRYFLFEYNLELQKRSKTDRPKIFWPEFIENKTDFVTVEHIYPQYARDEYWTTRFNSCTQKQRTILRNSLGNLLPLSKPKNSSLSNRPFPEKVDGKVDNIIGYRYGCYAENEVSKVNEWTPEEILKRGMVMLSFMEKRWGLEFGNDSQRKSILGLDFMNQI